ncbi:MAG: lamin tail domain-containing protein, partial [Kiritimatiellia bacterium]
MSRRAGIIGAALAGLALSAHAYTSAYTSLAVPGTHNGWATTPSMVLQADYVWVGTQTFASAGGAFKFAANGSWDVNWGGNYSILHVPARAVGGLAQGGSDVSYTNLATGQYRFTFYESTATFDLVPIVATAPAATNVQVVGSFNGDGASAVGVMSNVSGYSWIATNVDLDTGADFLFKTVSAAGAERWGAPATTALQSMPTNGTPSGLANYVVDGILGGRFTFAFNLQSNWFDVLQTYTNAFSVSTVSAAGSFVAGYPPDYNLEQISSSIWRSDFMVTNSGTLNLFFIGRNVAGVVGRYWGATNAAPMTLPVSGYMPAFYVSNTLVQATITNVVPGSYRITFDANSGAYSVVQRFTTASGANVLTNASFETLNANLPAGWGTYHAASGELADFGAHSGARCGVLFAKTVTNDWDLGSFDQTTGVFGALSGQTFRVAAAFRTQGAWEAESVRIIVEWRTNGTAFKEDYVDVVGLNEEWQIHSLEAQIPRDNVSAKVLFKYDGDPGTGFLLVDDAEARLAASRFQNFDAWGNVPTFQNIQPGDWEATHGKTLYNLPSGSLTGGVMISKYIEGGGNNKAIEIFNGMTGAVDLAAGGYVLQQYDNGATGVSTNVALTGTIPGGGTLVVSRPATPPAYAPDGALRAVPLSLTNKALTFNGDDAIVLRRGGAAGPVLDRVGQVGTNVAGSVWSRAATDRTLHRSHGVLQGLTNHPTNSFALADWTLLPQDDFSELGVHFFSLDDPNAPYVPSGYSLLLNTNASLLTPELDGGIGDVSFYARAQGALAGSALQLALETAPSLG